MSDKPPARPSFLPATTTRVHRGRKFDVYQSQIPKPAGQSGSYTHDLIVHPGAVVILPILDDGRVVLIRNKRWSVQETLWELPAGTLEPPEPPIASAARELIEETGYDAGELLPLVNFYSSPGFCTELLHCFVARKLRHVGQQLEETEDIRVEPLALPDVLEMIRQNEIRDAKTIAAILHHHLLQQK